MSNDSSSHSAGAPEQSQKAPMPAQMTPSSADANHALTEQARGAAWGPVAGVLYGLGVFIGSQVGIAVLLGLLLSAQGKNVAESERWLNDSVTAQFAFILLAETVTVAAIVWYIRHRKGTLQQLGLTRFRFSHVLMALAGFGVYFLAYIVMAGITSTLLPSVNLDQKQDIGFDTATTVAQLLLTFLSLVILPPLAEEIVFRGFMFTGLRRVWSFLPAAIVTSLLFASGHLLGGVSGEPLLWVAGLDTFVLSLVLCHLREKSGSLWPSIVVHAIKNGLAFTVLFLLK